MPTQKGIWLQPASFDQAIQFSTCLQISRMVASLKKMEEPIDGSLCSSQIHNWTVWRASASHDHAPLNYMVGKNIQLFANNREAWEPNSEDSLVSRRKSLSTLKCWSGAKILSSPWSDEIMKTAEKLPKCVPLPCHTRIYRLYTYLWIAYFLDHATILTHWGVFKGNI